MAEPAEVLRQEPEYRESPRMTVVPGTQHAQWGNPAVVGLMGFATTAMVAGLQGVGYWNAGPALALAIVFGGLTQFIAGIIDLRKGSIFGGTAFMAYGAFWLSLVVLDAVLPKAGIAANPNAFLGFFIMWTLFTFSFFLASLNVGNHLAVLFGLTLIAFLLVDFVAIGIVLPAAAGWEIFLTGLAAWYIATAILVNGVSGRTILPHS